MCEEGRGKNWGMEKGKEEGGEEEERGRKVFESPIFCLAQTPAGGI